MRAHGADEHLRHTPRRLRGGDIMLRAAEQPPTSALDDARPREMAPVSPDDAFPREAAPISLDARLGELEASLITWALKACDGKASLAAKLLQIKRSTLQDRMKRYHLDPRSALRAAPSDLAASA